MKLQFKAIGKSEIRTHGTHSRTHAFEACTLNHSVIFPLICVLGIFCRGFATLIDLEAIAQDWVLEAKKIEIPEYPHAFNPSIIRWRNDFLLSFRVIPDPKSPFTSFIGLVWLGSDFSPMGPAQLLQTRSPHSSVPSRAEDGRLLLVNDQLYLIYDDNEDEKISRKGFRMVLAELFFDGQFFSLGRTERILYFEDESPLKREKSWVPFDFQGELLLAYSLNPHRILRPIFGSETAVTIASTSGMIPWGWGELRGGTPALELDGEYLAFFHSVTKMASVQSEENILPHYFMGAYTFSREPPFQLTRISSEPIIGKGFYDSIQKYKPYWHPALIIFPCGYVYDDQSIWVVYGKQDHELWVAKLDRKCLFEHLSEISLLYDR